MLGVAHALGLPFLNAAGRSCPLLCQGLTLAPPVGVGACIVCLEFTQVSAQPLAGGNCLLRG